MLLRVHDIPADATLEADLCIVGAGPAGITVAREFAGGRRRVIVLESGGLELDPETTALSGGTVTGRPYFPLEEARSRVLGGTTEQWAGECRALDELDFLPHEWIPASGWPFERAALDPYYERARPICEIGDGPFLGDWTALGLSPLERPGDRFRTAGLHYSPRTHFGARYRDELAAAENIRVVLGATAVELETPADPGRLSAVRAAALSGRQFRVAARAYVLACGGIENPRLLLESDRVAVDGLGNAHGLVGRYFMEHLFLDEAAVMTGPPGAVSDFYWPGREIRAGRVRGILELDPETRRRERLGNFAGLLSSVTRDSARLAARYVAFETLKGRRPVAGWRRFRAAAEHLAASGPGRQARYWLKNAMEQVPNADSRIVLGRELDQLGCRRVELQWRLSAEDKQTAHRAHAILAEDFASAGVRFTSLMGEESDPWPAGVRGARHHMGTTRMHIDPKRGVVDGECRVHGIGNLYLAGSSVFPTSGAANPTLTIVALALRLADRLIDRLAARSGE